LDLHLAQKRVLITGGSKGIGLACAKAFLAEGARVAIVSRSEQNLAAAAAQLPDVATFAADLTDSAAAAKTVAEAEAEFGPVDILVNSAGAARRVAIDDLTPAAWRAAMDAKFFAYINVCDPLVKLMAARGSGVIVNIIGSGGKMASVTHLSGGAANAALMLATAGLGAAYAGRGVRVVGVNPTLTETERFLEGLNALAKQKGVSLDEARALSVASLPLGRLTRPDEIADAVLYLASDRASYISGVTIGVEGAQYPTVL
jgi:NAD(P)-dependent dehydrogenase (short-subunit alcohol dehydrogenase family)